MPEICEMLVDWLEDRNFDVNTVLGPPRPLLILYISRWIKSATGGDRITYYLEHSDGKVEVSRLGRDGALNLNISSPTFFEDLERFLNA